MKNTIFVILILILFFSFSCSVKCPCMNAEDLTWFPYHVNDTLCYVNHNNDSLFLKIENVDLSDEYEEKYKYKNKCITIANILAQNHYETSFEIYTSNRDWQRLINISFDIHLHDQKPYTKGEGGITIFTDEIKSRYINNKYYEETAFIERDTLQFDDDIWKTYIAKGYGIVQFHDRTSGYIWNLVHE